MSRRCPATLMSPDEQLSLAGGGLDPGHPELSRSCCPERRKAHPALPKRSIACLNTTVEQVRLPVIPDQCRMHHPWGPGLVTIGWEPCECAPAQAARGGHIAVRCLQPRCEEEWLAPRHHRT